MRLVPAGDPPHRGGPAGLRRDRLAMLRLAVREFPGLVVDRREIERAGKSYTVLTLEELRARTRARPLLLLAGADAFRGLADLASLARDLPRSRTWSSSRARASR